MDYDDVPSFIDISSMPSENDSFVHIMGYDDTVTPPTTNSHPNAPPPPPPSSPIPTLSLKLTPKHDSIGTMSPLSQTQVCATVTARDIPPENNNNSRASVDIVVALDVSGSMSGTKLNLCKVTLKLLLGELCERDRFGLVVFSSTARTVLPVKRLTPPHRDRATFEIERLQTKDTTNISGGIGLAMQEMRAVEERPNEVRCVFLLTDGHANVGIRDAGGIVALAKNCLNQLSGNNNPPVTIHTFGYGSDHDDELLRTLSLTSPVGGGAGTYYFVETDDNVVSAFGDALGGILSVVAQNTVLTLSVVAPDVRLIDVHHGSKTVVQEGRVYKVAMGDFYAQETRDVIFTTTLAESPPHNAVERPVPHVQVSMDYTDTIDKKMVTVAPVAASINRPFRTDAVSKTDPYVAWQCLRIDTTAVMAKAQNIAKRGDVDAARGVVNDQLEKIRGVAAEIDGGDGGNPLAAQLVSDLTNVLGGLLDRGTFRSYGGKVMRNTIASHRHQRSGEASPTVMNMYRTSRKKFMSQKCYNSAFGK